MAKAPSQPYPAILVILLTGGAISWAGSQGSVMASRAPFLEIGFPLFALCGAFAFIVNWLVFIPAYVFQTEHYFDLTGSLTYLASIGLVLLNQGFENPRALLIALVAIWATRLGSFLFLRVRRDGSDGRFDVLKPNFGAFLMTWTLQGLWVFLTFACGLAAMTSQTQLPLGGWALVGSVCWLSGFVIECVADSQKRAFRADPLNEGRFISTGLWSWSRHPNYFGEIVLWVGIALIALPALSGWQYVTLISPVFVYILLTRISGIPLLEARAKKRWGNQDAYRAYKSGTSALVPRPPTTA